MSEIYKIPTPTAVPPRLMWHKHVHPYEIYTNYKTIMDDRVVVIIKL